MRYLRGAIDIGMGYSSDLAFGKEWSAYVSSASAGEQEKRLSTTGAVYFLAGGSMDRTSKLQPAVTSSVFEAEHVPPFESFHMTVCSRHCYRNIGFDRRCPNVYEDKGTVKISEVDSVSSYST